MFTDDIQRKKYFDFKRGENKKTSWHHLENKYFFFNIKLN